MLRQFARGRLAGLSLSLLLLSGSAASTLASDQKLPFLSTKHASFTNVTVTTKAKTYIFIMHSTGLANIKVSDLSPESMQALGYAPAPGAADVDTVKARTLDSEPFLVTDEPAKSGGELPKEEKEPDPQKRHGSPFKVGFPKDFRVILAFVLLLAIAFHVFMSYCMMLICKKVDSEPGFLIWLPVLQMFPLLRAAGMPSWWFFVSLVVPLFPWILWSINIVKALQKGFLALILLIVPVTTPFGLAYLAFAPAKKPEGKMKFKAFAAPSIG